MNIHQQWGKKKEIDHPFYFLFFVSFFVCYCLCVNSGCNLGLILSFNNYIENRYKNNNYNCYDQNVSEVYRKKKIVHQKCVKL